MFIVYDFIFLIFAIFSFPLYLLKGKLRGAFLSRLGILSLDTDLKRPIWIHAVSVGEAITVKNLLNGLKNSYPHKKFVISTVTSTGNKIAKTLIDKNDFVTYLPLDFSLSVRLSINKIKPALFILAETEIWPNLISYLYRKNIPIVVVNARISDHSFRGYLSIKLFIRPVLNKVSLFCAQSLVDAQRLMRLGVREEKITVTGNMKFDIVSNNGYKENNNSWLKLSLGLNNNERLFIAGSTHPGEEGMVLGAYKKLNIEFPDLVLLIAPRHPERSREIARLISSFGFKAVFISELSSAKCQNCIPKTVFILDIIGRLVDFYQIADIVFVGGSLIKKGGHNILEPALLAKPILIGPYMFNFREISELFLKNKACILIHNQEEMFMAVKNLLENPSQQAALGRLAEGLVVKNQGATQRNLELIKKIYKTS